LGVISSSAVRGQAIMDEQRNLFKQRASGLYKIFRGGSMLDFVFTSKQSDQLARRLRYATLLAEHDKSNLRRFGDLVRALNKEKEQIEVSEREASFTIETLKTLEKSLAGEKEKQEKLRISLEKRKNEHQASLQRLEGSLEELELVLARIMGGEEPVPTKLTKFPVSPKPKPVPHQPDSAPTEPKTRTINVTRGLAYARGKLPYPVRGGIIREFGNQKHSRFEDQVFNKGVDFQASAGSPVIAVADATVRLNQVIPELGQVVILEHGKRYYTLYGRLGGVSVSLGEEVAAGTQVGTVAEPDKEGRSLHFEIRHLGKAKNPVKFFKKS